LFEIVPFELLQIAPHAELCLGQLFHPLGEIVYAADQSVKTLRLLVHPSGQLPHVFFGTVLDLGQLTYRLG
jgi:hypothetical protein